MSLYSKKERYAAASESVSIAIEDDAPPTIDFEDLEEAEDSMEIVTEAIYTAIQQRAMLSSMVTTLESKKPATDSYMASIETISSIVSRLGVRKFPSIEDFSNKYSSKASSEIAIEGIKDFLMKIWEKIKAFFREFWKKVSIFYKRLMKMDLDLESYEKYTEKLIAKLNINKAKLKDSNIILNSNLPKLLSDRGQEAIDVRFLLGQGMVKIRKLVELGNYVLKPDGYYSYIREGLKNIRVKVAELERLGNTQVKGAKIAAINREKSLVVREVGVGRIIGEVINIIAGMYSAMFKYRINGGLRAIPDVVAERINNAMKDGVSNGEIIVMSLVPDNEAIINLPRGSNVFIAIPLGKNMENVIPIENNIPVDAIIVGNVDEKDYVVNKLKVVNELSTLTKLYKDYKHILASYKTSGVIKIHDELMEDLEDTIEMVGKVLTGSIEQVKVVAKGDSGGMAKILNFVNIVVEKKDDLNGYSGVKNIIAQKDTSLDSRTREAISECIDLINKFIETPTESSVLAGELSKVNGITEEILLKIYHMYFNSLENIEDQDQSDGVKGIKDALVAGGSSEPIISKEDETKAAELKQTLHAFNDYIVNFFRRLQASFTEVTIVIYKQIAEIRYNMIKYIYDVANCYSY